jgi:quinone-modifying oxidoreductase subunit QmoC
MSMQVDPALHRELQKFGAGDLDACFNCGNCTAVCPLSRDSTVFPRRIIRYLQLGLKDQVRRSPEPWLCYYCGECSQTCPRNANPGETMMAARRYLTTQYDWTGLSKRLYLSKAWEIGALLAIGLFVVVLFYLFHGPVVPDHVALNTFAPAEWVEIGDWAMAALLSVLLLSNAYRLYRFVMRDTNGPRIPPSLYLKELATLFVHGLTQKRWKECESATRWWKHFLLVSAYITMFTLVVVFLRWFQTDEIRPFWHPTRLLGYYATAVLLYVTAEAMISRRRKQEEIHKYSHATDWMFLALLFLTALTGILVHAFRLGGFALGTYYMYVIHLAIAVPMLVVEVPFGKWAHLLYRPLVIYLMKVKQRAGELHSLPAVAAAA